MKDGRHIARQGLAKVRIEIRKPGTVDDEVQITSQMRLHRRGNSQAWLAHVALDDFDAPGDKLREPVTEPLLQGVKYRRFLENFLKAALCRRGALTANQDINFADLRDLVQKL